MFFQATSNLDSSHDLTEDIHDDEAGDIGTQILEQHFMNESAISSRNSNQASPNSNRKSPLKTEESFITKSSFHKRKNSDDGPVIRYYLQKMFI